MRKPRRPDCLFFRGLSLSFRNSTTKTLKTLNPERSGATAKHQGSNWVAAVALQLQDPGQDVSCESQ